MGSIQSNLTLTITRKQVVVFSGSLIIVLMMTVLALWAAEHRPLEMEQLCREDGFVETGTAIAYLAAGLIFCWIGATRVKIRWATSFLAALMIFVAGEELNWGQRIFEIETPSQLAEVNVQGEISVHNLSPLHGITRALGLLFILGYCLILPLIAKIHHRTQRYCSQYDVPLYPFHASGWIFLAVLLMAIPRFAFGTISYELDELGEAVLALAFLYFSMNCLLNVNRKVSTAL
ncbi:MAG: hypothetical protein Tsb009_18800 [Planctomycetaceae bacterium]